MSFRLYRISWKLVVTSGHRFHLNSPKRPCSHSCARQGRRGSPTRWDQLKIQWSQIQTIYNQYTFTEKPPTMVSTSFWMWQTPQKSWTESMWWRDKLALLFSTPEKAEQFIQKTTPQVKLAKLKNHQGTSVNLCYNIPVIKASSCLINLQVYCSSALLDNI